MLVGHFQLYNGDSLRNFSRRAKASALEKSKVKPRVVESLGGIQVRNFECNEWWRHHWHLVAELGAGRSKVVIGCGIRLQGDMPNMSE